jgi:carbamoyltransferase
MKDRLNCLKQREDYRPVAPVCLEYLAATVFDPGDADPFMLFEQRVRPEWAERVAAVCHEDGTARVQTVSEADNRKLFELLREYHRLSGVPVLCNTSANWPGRGFFPDVQSAAEWGRVPYIWCADTLYAKDT